MNNKDNKKIISAEKMAVLVEKGLSAVKLSKDERAYLLSVGFEELHCIHECLKQPMANTDRRLAAKILESITTIKKNKPNETDSSVWVKIKEKSIELVSCLPDWSYGSPAFDTRGGKKGEISFCRKIGKKSIHFKISKCNYSHANLHILLKENVREKSQLFTIGIFKGKRCIESKQAYKNNEITLSYMEIDNYRVYLKDAQGEILSLNIVMKD